jgi:putative component of toxin-antitoxin plasmid stabilization module
MKKRTIAGRSFRKRYKETMVFKLYLRRLVDTEMNARIENPVRRSSGSNASKHEILQLIWGLRERVGEGFGHWKKAKEE